MKKGLFRGWGKSRAAPAAAGKTAEPDGCKPADLQTSPPAAAAVPSADPGTAASAGGDPPAAAEVAVTAAPVTAASGGGFFAKLRRTRANFAAGLSALMAGGKIDDECYDQLETALLTADVGVATAETIIERLRTQVKLRELRDVAALRQHLHAVLAELLQPICVPWQPAKLPGRPYVILVVGVNGVGKTTTIGKLAQQFKDQGLSCLLGAGDTFRAAAGEQLQAWGRRIGVPVVAQTTGADSASVLFDALQAATARGTDVLLCDTAGRLQNKEQLMQELAKIVRVMRKLHAAVPDEVLLVLDATVGQNALSQVKLFHATVPVTGLCLTKLDGTAKGGVVFPLAAQFKIPLRYVGVGERAEDLRPFDPEQFVTAVLGTGAA